MKRASRYNTSKTAQLLPMHIQFSPIDISDECPASGAFVLVKASICAAGVFEFVEERLPLLLPCAPTSAACGSVICMFIIVFTFFPKPGDASVAVSFARVRTSARPPHTRVLTCLHFEWPQIHRPFLLPTASEACFCEMASLRGLAAAASRGLHLSISSKTIG